MIRNNPTDGEVLSAGTIYRPRTCFLMTKRGTPLPGTVRNMRRTFEKCATSVVAARDFLLKIWNLIDSLPLGIAIVSEELSTPTMCHIYYKSGVLQSLGKKPSLIKSPSCPILSDFVRTEYIEYGKTVGKKLNQFFKTYFSLADHYANMAEGLEQNPALAIDDLKRAFLISRNKNYQAVTNELFEKNQFDVQRTESVMQFLQAKN